MNSQFIPQQPSQYGAPSGPGFGPPQGPNKSAPNESGFQQPLQMTGPQRGGLPLGMVQGNLPPSGSPNVSHSVPNGPSYGPPNIQGPHSMQGMTNQQGAPSNPGSQGFLGPANFHGSGQVAGLPMSQSGPSPQHPQPGPQTMQPHLGSGIVGSPSPTPNQVASQMAGINIGGPPRVPNSGLPITPNKAGMTPPVSGPPNNYPGVINGGPLPVQGPQAESVSLQKTHSSSGKQFVNGSMGPPSASGGGPMPSHTLLHAGLPPGLPTGMMPPPHFSGPPPPPPHASGMTHPQSNMAPHPGNMLPPRGILPLPGSGMPPLPGAVGGPLQGNVPPPGRLPYSQPGVPPPVDTYQGSMSGPPLGSSGAYGSQQTMGSPQVQAHNYSQLSPQPPQSHPSMQTQQARRLDPDQMPSPIQVMQDDQRNRTGIFYTNQKGQVPPLVTTNFVTQDQGNAGPRYIRSTMYNIPATIDMMKQTAVPFGLVLSPLARTVEGEYLPPIVDMGEMGPVRCIRCKAYMCPFMQFIDGGRRFHCLFCKATTEVPAEYFQHLDHTGQRVDRFDRPELMFGTYEFVATKDYCRNNAFPKPPALIFLIDVSYNNMKSGMVHLLCKEMKEILKLLPKDAGAERSAMRVGFITYNNTVHFYNIKGCLAQPQMMVVGDVQDMFMPLLEGFLCDPSESEAVIDSLMEQIPTMFADTRETETVLAPAIQAGLEALKASECAGKLLVFHSSLPIAEAPGKLKNRDERKLLATEKEKTVLAPQVNSYNNLGQDCVGAGCSVDLFVFNNSYIDIATIGQVCRLTGGEIFKYTYFQADLDGDRLISDIKNNISRPIAFDSIMRVRTSTGVRATDFYGHFFMSNTTDMELASIDCDKAVAVEIKHDDKLTEEDGVYIQVALLYTSCGGQRRLRVLNLSFKTCTQMADLYRSCDLDSIVNFFSKQVVFRLLESSPKQVKDGLVNRCAQMLACYRKNCASPSSAGQLILPECMKLLPLYVNCILKSDSVSGGSDMTIDDRSFVMQAVSIMDLPSSVVYFYPRLIPLHDVDVNSSDIPASIRCTADKIRDEGVYLLENGVHMFLWIGLNVGMDWVQDVFGVHSAAQIDIDRTTLPELDNPLSQRISSLVSTIRHQRHRSMRLTLVRQRDKLEMVFKHFLVEDRGFDGSASYVDFLCHMHKEIRNLLS